MKLTWKRSTAGEWYASLGNNLYLLIKPVTIWVAASRGRRGRDRRYWDPAVIAGNPFLEPIIVRRWGGGGNGHGQYKTLTAAKAGGIEDAKSVGLACLRSLGMEV